MHPIISLPLAVLERLNDALRVLCRRDQVDRRIVEILGADSHLLLRVPGADGHAGGFVAVLPHRRHPDAHLPEEPPLTLIGAG
jgi:hypothetical protein